MSRSTLASVALASFLALFLVPTPARAQNTCNLAVAISCANGQCTSISANNGSNACSGTIITGFEAPNDPQAMLTGFKAGISLPECFDSTSFPGQQFAFAVCLGPGSLAPGSTFTSTVNVSGAAPNAPIFAVTGVEDEATGTILGLAYAISNSIAPTCTPSANVPSATLSGVQYTVSWTPVVDPAATYVVEESTASDFSTITATIPTSATSAQFQHSVTTATTFYYRVRAATCSGQPGANSTPVSIVVTVPVTTPRGTDVVVPLGTTSPFVIPVTVQLASSAAGNTYSATMDKPYYTVSPATGTVPQSGQLQLLITADPSTLPAGASTGTLTITTKAPGTTSTLDSTTTSLPISVSLVTPVTPGGKTLPPPNALVIPVVTHVVGSGNTPFVSDVRLTNASTSSVNYQVSYTPANSDGTQTGKITNLTVPAGQTVALNDIAKDFFGVGATSSPGDAGSGALEIRPVNSVSTATYASSRTYASTSNGTYGQFIAAIPFSQFATQLSVGLPVGGTTPTGPAPLLSLQQVAQSTKFRTNLGLVEGSGTPATGNVNIYDDSGALLKTVPFSLQPGEQKQLNHFIDQVAGIPNLNDGRIEIQVTSATGAVSAYASVLDNLTTDPLAVTPVVASSIHSTRYVIPGIAELNTGTNFHSDIRLFNGGLGDANVTLTFYPQGNGTPVAMPAFTIPKGQIKAIDNVLPTFFGVTAGGGSIVATTSGDSSIVATGRTYSLDAQGRHLRPVHPRSDSDSGHRRE